MTPERVAAAAVMLGLAVLLGSVGWAGRAGKLTYALGGWTRADATPDSWDAAHRSIGVGLLVAGSVAALTAAVVVVAPSDWTGSLVVAGCAALLIPTVIGVVGGVSRLERR